MKREHILYVLEHAYDPPDREEMSCRSHRGLMGPDIKGSEVMTKRVAAWEHSTPISGAAGAVLPRG
ncbi:hypothetical protein GCM10010255_80300 [Streptomyces coeruleofuscus]|uniref:Uncharacterized protein n=1 Tax=Streptomyces coeruleofuscus TaxID=66879 RepID=A0ABP5WF12_9ACTN